MEERVIVIRPHQYPALQRQILGEKFQHLEVSHGPRLVARVDEILRKIKDDPKTRVRIDVVGASICGEGDCMVIDVLHCGSDQVMELERRKAREYNLEIGRTYCADELFEMRRY